MDTDPCSSFGVEGKNVATYYFKHVSEGEQDPGGGLIGEDEELCDSEDSDQGIFSMSLNYSKEDIRALASQAEQMVMNKTRAEPVVGRLSGYQTSCQASVDTEDSDYGSKLEFDSFISSEPNIAVLRRSTPKKSYLNAVKKNWRHSLPASLEYFSESPDKTSDTAPDPDPDIEEVIDMIEKLSDQEDPSDMENSSVGEISSGELSSCGRISEPPLKDLWEEEQIKSETPWTADSECPNEIFMNNVLNFGEDYERQLDRFPESASSTGSDEEVLLRRNRDRQKRKVRKGKLNKFPNNIVRDNTTNVMVTNSRIDLNKNGENLQDIGPRFIAEGEELLPKEACRNHMKSLESVLLTENNLRTEREIQTLHCRWEKLFNDWSHLSDQSAAYQAITSSITNMREELGKISSFTSSLVEQPLSGHQQNLDTWQNAESFLQKLKQRLFPLNLSVHELLCSVSSHKKSHPDRVSLVSQCKQEVTQLYRLWEETNNSVTSEIQKIRNLSYQLEFLNKELITLSTLGEQSLNTKSISCDSGFSEDTSLCDKIYDDSKLIVKLRITRLKQSMSELRKRSVISDSYYHQVLSVIHKVEVEVGVEQKLNSKKVGGQSRWTWSWWMVGKATLTTSLFLFSVLSATYLLCQPKCCDSTYWSIYESLWPKLSFPHGPPPI